MGIVPGSMVAGGGCDRQSPSRVPHPSRDFVPSPQLAASPLGAEGCPKAAGGERRWCLIFQSNSLKACCSLGLVQTQYPWERAGIRPPPAPM